MSRCVYISISRYLEIWRAVMDIRADGWPMPQEPPAWLDSQRCDRTANAAGSSTLLGLGNVEPQCTWAQAARSSVHAAGNARSLKRTFCCVFQVPCGGLALFFVAAFSPTPARFVLLRPPRITTCDSHHHHAALSQFPRRTTHLSPRRMNKVNVL